MFKKGIIVFLALSLFLTANISAQDSALVKWSIASKKITETIYELVITAKVTAGKYVYVYGKGVEGLDSLQINFTDSAISKITSLKIIKGSKDFKDPIFENKTVVVSDGELQFSQQIKLTVQFLRI